VSKGCPAIPAGALLAAPSAIESSRKLPRNFPSGEAQTSQGMSSTLTFFIPTGSSGRKGQPALRGRPVRRGARGFGANAEKRSVTKLRPKNCYERNDMPVQRFVSTLLGALVVVASLGSAQMTARADTATTAAIVAGAAAIVGALLYDANNRPYYIRSGHRYYVTQAEAGYWRGHHPGVERRAYVPEQEFPVARDPYHSNRGGMGRPEHR
jgi:hypothetical protein